MSDLNGTPFGSVEQRNARILADAFQARKADVDQRLKGLEDRLVAMSQEIDKLRQQFAVVSVLNRGSGPTAGG